MTKGLLSKEVTGFLLVGGLVTALILNILFTQPFSFGLAFALVVALSVLFLYNPYVGIVLLLTVRTAVDKIGNNYSFEVWKNISLNANALLGLLLIGLAIIFIVFRPDRSRKIFSTISAAWLLYLIVASISIFYSIEPLLSVYELFRLLSIFFIFILGYLIISPKRPDDGFKAVMWASIIPLSAAFYQLLTSTGMGRIAGLKSRVYGTFSDPNSFAAFILIIIAITIYFIIQKKNTQKLSAPPAKEIILLTFLMILLVATFSRGGWLALIIFIAILSIFKNPKFLLLFLGGLILAVILVEPIRDRVQDVYNPPITGSVYWRIQQWDKLSKLATKEPLTGYGLGTEVAVYEKEFGFHAGNPYTHNDILKNTLETGVFGALAYIILLLTTLITLLVKYFKTKNPTFKNILLVVFILFFAEVIFSMTSNILRSTVIQWIIWFLVGASLALVTATTKSKRIN